MRISLLILLCISSVLIFSETVKVGIVGYTLLDEFRIENNQNCIITVDDKNYYGENLLISRSGEIIGDSFDTLFRQIKIENPGIITFISNKGLQTYRGDFVINYNDGLTIINVVDKNHYLTSVLGSEMGLSFHPEALKAQLLAIKLFYDIRKERNINHDWDILNTSRVMAYRGEEYTNPKLLNIVKDLHNTNLVLPDNIEPMFFSTASGYILKQYCLTSTIDSRPENPVLVKDDNQNSPYYNFKVEVSDNKLKEILGNVMDLKDISEITVIKFNNSDCNDFIGFKSNDDKSFTWLKAYRFVSIMQQVYGSEFKSIQFNVKKDDNIFTFTGKGFGHFIGMSQYGAQEMAIENKSFSDIILKYYPDAVIE